MTSSAPISTSRPSSVNSCPAADSSSSSSGGGGSGDGDGAFSGSFAATPRSSLSRSALGRPRCRVLSAGAKRVERPGYPPGPLRASGPSDGLGRGDSSRGVGRPPERPGSRARRPRAVRLRQDADARRGAGGSSSTATTTWLARTFASRAAASSADGKMIRSASSQRLNRGHSTKPFRPSSENSATRRSGELGCGASSCAYAATFRRHLISYSGKVNQRSSSVMSAAVSVYPER